MKYNRMFVERVLSLVWIIVIVTVVLQIYLYARPVWNQIERFDLFLAVTGIIAGLISGLPSVWIIKDYFRRLTENHSWALAFILTFLPAIGKYIPGKLWVAGSFILHAKNLAAVNVGDSVLYQIYFQITGITATIVLLLAGALTGDQVIYSIELLATAILILCGFFILLNHLIRMVGKYGTGLRMNRMLPHIFALVTQKILRGLSLVVFISAFTEVDAHVISILFAFFIAMQIGVLAFFAPAGLGITEGVYMVILSPLLGIESAILIALLSRIWQTTLDAMLATLAFGVKRYQMQELAGI